MVLQRAAQLRGQPVNTDDFNSSDVGRGRAAVYSGLFASHDSGSRGFVFVGTRSVSGRPLDACAQLRRAVGGVRRHSALPVAFVGDAAAAAEVAGGCAKLFDAVVDAEREFKLCGLSALTTGVDARAWKLCVRARGLAPFAFNVQLDWDVSVENAAIGEVFDVLSEGRFDLAAVWECCAVDANSNVKSAIQPPGAKLMRGFELQTGVLGFANSLRTLRHAQAAVTLYVEAHQRTELASS